jgi:hypothetical protein
MHAHGHRFISLPLCNKAVTVSDISLVTTWQNSTFAQHSFTYEFFTKNVISFLNNINLLASLRVTPRFTVMREIKSYIQPNWIFRHAAKFRVRSRTGPSEIFVHTKWQRNRFSIEYFCFSLGCSIPLLMQGHRHRNAACFGRTSGQNLGTFRQSHAYVDVAGPQGRGVLLWCLLSRTSEFCERQMLPDTRIMEFLNKN